MANTNQVTTSVADLISKLNTFLTGVGWTTHHNPGSGEFAARNTGTGFDIGFACQWDTATPNNLGIYHFHDAAYNSGASPWAQNDDSGNGAASTSNATLATSRFVDIAPSDNPVQFWCYAEASYFHVVVQYSSTEYRHFGAGYLDKYNDWTGGEYVYGCRKETVLSNVNSAATSILLDTRLRDTGAFNTAELFAATVRIEGMDDAAAGAKYGVCVGAQADRGNDRQTVPVARLRLLGGYGGGMLSRIFSQYRGTIMRASCPLWPIIQWYWNATTNNVYPLSQMPNVRGCNIRDFAPGDEIVLGSDTWVLFPAIVKATSDAAPSAIGSTAYQGIAYKKVT